MAQYDPEELGREPTRKRASRLIDEKPLIQGTLVQSLRSCGSPGCRCHHGGPKHSATYLAIRQGKKRTMVFVPQSILPYVKECVVNHQHIQQALDIVSRDCIEVFLSRKRMSNKTLR
jgi:hypothetical protein